MGEIAAVSPKNLQKVQMLNIYRDPEDWFEL